MDTPLGVHAPAGWASPWAPGRVGIDALLWASVVGILGSRASPRRHVGGHRCHSVWAGPCPPPSVVVGTAMPSLSVVSWALGRHVGIDALRSGPAPMPSPLGRRGHGIDALPFGRRGLGIDALSRRWASMPFGLGRPDALPPRSSWVGIVTPLRSVGIDALRGGIPPRSSGHRPRRVGMWTSMPFRSSWASSVVMGTGLPLGRRPPRPWASMPSVIFGPRSGGARRPPFLGLSSPRPFAPWLPPLSIVSGSLVVVGVGREADFSPSHPTQIFEFPTKGSSYFVQCQLLGMSTFAGSSEWVLVFGVKRRAGREGGRDGRTDGRTDKIDRQTDRYTDRQTDRQTDHTRPDQTRP